METFIIDLDQKKSFISRIYLRQGDGGFQKVLIQIIKNGAEYNASGYSVVFEANLSDGRLVQGNAVARDEVKGLFEYTFRRADTAAVGTMRNAYFKVLDASGNALSTRDVNIIVAKSAVLPTFQHDELLTDVENLVNEVDEKTQELLNSTSSKLSENNQAIANQAEEIAELQEALSDVSLHQAWATGENGEGFSQVKHGENFLFKGAPSVATGSVNKFDAYYLVDVLNPSASERSFIQFGNLVNWDTLKNVYAGATVSIGIEIYVESMDTGAGKDSSIFLRTTNASGTFVNAPIIYLEDYLKLNEWFFVSASSVLQENIDWSNSGKNLSIAFGAGKKIKFRYRKFKLEINEKATPYLPAPQDDPINCYPKYVGFGIMSSDNYQDYKWILNPEWAMANAIYGTEITTFKSQLSDMQTWIQAHS